jgi:hypothetical protein
MVRSKSIWMFLCALSLMMGAALLTTGYAAAQEATPEAPPLDATTEPATAEPASVEPTPEPPTPTPFIPPTPQLPPPVLRAEAGAAYLVGAPIEIAFVLESLNSAPINSMDAHCALAPADILASAQVVAGAFAPDALVISSGLQPDGTWLFAVSQPSAALNAGVIFRVSAVTAAPGALSIQCVVTGVGMDGARLPMTLAPIALFIQDAPTAFPTDAPPTAEPAPIETPAELPPTPELPPDAPTDALPTAEEIIGEATPAPEDVTPVPEGIIDEFPPTEEASPTPELPTPAPLVVMMGSISGQIILSHADPVGVVVSLRDEAGAVLMLVTADDGGNFRFDQVAAGSYLVVAETDGYLRVTLPILLGEGGGAALGGVLLYAGDVVTSEPARIDELDVVQFSAWYAEPGFYDPRGDFNRDGRLDLLDMRALAQNLRRGG